MKENKLDQPKFHNSQDNQDNEEDFSVLTNMPGIEESNNTERKCSDATFMGSSSPQLQPNGYERTQHDDSHFINQYQFQPNEYSEKDNTNATTTNVSEAKDTKYNDHRISGATFVSNAEPDLKVEDMSISSNNSDIEVADSQENIVRGPPDGLYAWVVVICGFLAMATNLGIMEDYFEENFYQNDQHGLLVLSFVGTTAAIVLSAFSFVIQICIAKYGEKPVMWFCTFCISISLELASFANKGWQLILTQGILFGIGASCMYVSSFTITTGWFSKRRGLALGTVSSGVGIGGLVLPFIITASNEKLGVAWTYRILGLICFISNACGSIFITERVKSTKKNKKISEIVQLEVWKQAEFVYFAIGSTFIILGYHIPYFIIPVDATALGLTHSQGSALIAAMSASNFVGRLLAGFIADYIGNLNSNLIFTFLTSCTCLLIWVFANSYTLLIVFCVTYGLTSGSYYALMAPITKDLVSDKVYSSAISSLLIANIIGLFGTNIASAIQSNIYTSTPFLVYKLVSGSAAFIATLILLALKLKKNKNLLYKI